MRWIYRLERKLGRNFGVADLMKYVTATMLAVYVLHLLAMPDLYNFMIFYRDSILSGEFWRVFTFTILPPFAGGPLFVLLTLFIAYRIGTSLEYAWGKTLFTMYFILGMLGAIAAGFISGVGTNEYVLVSLILAFCYLNPNATFLLFFILPVKAKYIAIVNWAFFAWRFIQGDMSTRLAIVFSLINFFLFFGPEVWKIIRQNYQASNRRRKYQKSWGDNNPWR